MSDNPIEEATVARMLGKIKRTQDCGYGCCRGHEFVGHGKRQRSRARKERRAADERAWKREVDAHR